jgi:RNA polymerase sigma-70 factor (ECF subfamily)
MDSRDEHRAWVMAAVAAYEQRLVRFAARLVRDEHSARDIVQHTFLKLCGETEERIGEKLAQWLFTVCRNRAMDGLRLRRSEVSLDEAHFDGNGRLGGTLALRDGDPAEICAARELGERLLTLVETLPEAQRETLLLWLEGWSSPQVAEITGRQPATIRVQLHTALKSLRQHPRVRALLGGQQEHAPLRS